MVLVYLKVQLNIFMRSTFLFVALLFAVCCTAICQSTAIDSLNRLLLSAREDTSKVKLLLALGDEYQMSDSTGLEIAQRAYQLSRRANSEKFLAQSEAALGLVHFEMEGDSGLMLINQAIDRFKQTGQSNKISDTYWNISLVFERRSDFDSAIYYLEKSLKLAKTTGYNKGIADANYSLSIINNIRGNNSEALRHSLEAKEFYEKTGSGKDVSQALNQTGIIYDYMGMYAEAIDHYLQAREIAIEVKDVQGEILIINNLGVVYDNMDNTEAALEYYEEALEKAGIFEYEEDEATLLNNISYIYLKRGRYTSGTGSIMESITD